MLTKYDELLEPTQWEAPEALEISQSMVCRILRECENLLLAPIYAGRKRMGKDEEVEIILKLMLESIQLRENYTLETDSSNISILSLDQITPDEFSLWIADKNNEQIMPGAEEADIVKMLIDNRDFDQTEDCKEEEKEIETTPSGREIRESLRRIRVDLKRH
ncbi:hypothetical protein MXB_3131, partial [Myxobolus squamalis]